VEILRSIAGLIALFAVPIFLINIIKSYGFPYAGIPVELAFLFISTLLYLGGKWRIKVSIGVIVVALHTIFLWIVPGVHNLPCGGHFVQCPLQPPLPDSVSDKS
jgi:hypothetical protein